MNITKNNTKMYKSEILIFLVAGIAVLMAVGLSSADTCIEPTVISGLIKYPEGTPVQGQTPIIEVCEVSETEITTNCMTMANIQPTDSSGKYNITLGDITANMSRVKVTILLAEYTGSNAVFMNCGETRSLDLTLTSPSCGASRLVAVSGYVKYKANGTVVPGTLVIAYINNQNSGSAITNGDGVYFIALSNNNFPKDDPVNVALYANHSGEIGIATAQRKCADDSNNVVPVNISLGDCTSDTDCPGGTCNTTTHQCKPFECTNNLSCSGNQVCNITSHTCQNIICAPPNGAAWNHTCVNCTSNASCSSGTFCDLTTHQCQSGIYSIQLFSGWNLVSVPLNQVNNSVSSIFALAQNKCTRVYAWDAQNIKWLKYTSTKTDFTTIEICKGYWFYCDENVVLNVSGSALQCNLPLYEGWNLIGSTSSAIESLNDALSSISGKYTRVYNWDAQNIKWLKYTSTKTDFTTIEPGKGYWVNMDATGNLQ